MPEIIYLNNLKEGQCAVIDNIPSDCRLLSRFFSLGIVSGSAVKCVRRKKGTAAYGIGRSVFAIRDADARKITVRLTEGE